MQEKRKEKRFSKALLLEQFKHCLIEVVPGVRVSVEIIDVSRKGLGFSTVFPPEYFENKSDILIFPFKMNIELKAEIRHISEENGKTRIGIEFTDSGSYEAYAKFIEDTFCNADHSMI
ncbi:MAG: PilZ domain-containing protein [Spirochaetales bacterium]|nr:PilZ domain-containing protein [Spirochaetales bacterium]